MDKDELRIKVERLHRLDSEGALKGFADISVAGSFLIKGFKVMSGKKGLFVGMPSEQGKDGKWYNTVDVMDEDVKKEVSSAVLSAYEE